MVKANYWRIGVRQIENCSTSAYVGIFWPCNGVQYKKYDFQWPDRVKFLDYDRLFLFIFTDFLLRARNWMLST